MAPATTTSGDDDESSQETGAEDAQKRIVNSIYSKLKQARELLLSLDEMVGVLGCLFA